MKNFLVTWLLVQLIFIAIMIPFAYNNGIKNRAEMCLSDPMKINLPVAILLVGVPLLWFVGDMGICKNISKTK